MQDEKKMATMGAVHAEQKEEKRKKKMKADPATTQGKTRGAIAKAAAKPPPSTHTHTHTHTHGGRASAPLIQWRTYACGAAQRALVQGARARGRTRAEVERVRAACAAAGSALRASMAGRGAGGRAGEECVEPASVGLDGKNTARVHVQRIQEKEAEILLRGSL